jgi:uncharacterized membrane protein YeiH
MTPIDFPIGPVLSALDLAGLELFAATGAVAAARAKQTLVTFAFFALATGVGGGTVRDLLIGAPVFWIEDTRPLTACLVIALVIWITPERLWRGRALDWLDAVGMAAYAVFGAAKGFKQVGLRGCTVQTETGDQDVGGGQQFHRTQHHVGAGDGDQQLGQGQGRQVCSW